MPNKILSQYRDLKAHYPDHLLLVQLGDFYEAFDDDARTLADTCDLTLAGRGLGDVRAPMAGVPFFSIHKYLQILITHGQKVALAEPFGSDMTNGLLPREVTRVIERENQI